MNATSPAETVLTPESLRNLRRGLGLTQTALADAIGLSLRAYQDLESGKSEIRKLHELAIRHVMATGTIKHQKPRTVLIEVRSGEKTFHVETAELVDEEDLEKAMVRAIRAAREVMPRDAFLDCQTIISPLENFI